MDEEQTANANLKKRYLMLQGPESKAKKKKKTFLMQFKHYCIKKIYQLIQSSLLKKYKLFI